MLWVSAPGFSESRGGACRPGGLYCRNHRQDNEEDRARLRRYFEQRVATLKKLTGRLIIKLATACREERA